MKRIAWMLCAVVGLTATASPSFANWGSLCYSGYQPWWNIFAKRYKCLTPEEERLQKFWHDYYHALKEFYCSLDHIDWVAYYKNHGYQINGGCGPMGGCCGRINYAPVVVLPGMSWAVPAGPACGPAAGPPMGPMGQMGQMPGPMGPMGPMGQMPPMCGPGCQMPGGPFGGPMVPPGPVTPPGMAGPPAAPGH